MNILAIGPMSPEIIEAVYKYSHNTHRPFQLIASKNQIDYKGGYVNDWDTKQYMNFIKTMRQTYLDASVLICRDHCGPGFNGSDDLADVYKTIETDIRSGFDLIHIDFCHYKGPRSNALAKASEAIKYAKRLNPRIRFEVGTDEIGKKADLFQIRQDVEFFLSHCTPDYYVVNTGSLVKEDRQSGVFNKEITRSANMLLRDYNLKLKEHNADYLTVPQIVDRKGLVDAMNIAPELGVRQTECVLRLCNQYKVDTEAFMAVSYKSKKWKKWLELSNPDDEVLCSTLAGHYNFSTKEYQRLIKHLGDHVNVKETLVNEAIKVLDRYATNF